MVTGRARCSDARIGPKRGSPRFRNRGTVREADSLSQNDGSGWTTTYKVSGNLPAGMKGLLADGNLDVDSVSSIPYLLFVCLLTTSVPVYGNCARSTAHFCPHIALNGLNLAEAFELALEIDSIDLLCYCRHGAVPEWLQLPPVARNKDVDNALFPQEWHCFLLC